MAEEQQTKQGVERGPALEPYQVILRPLVTEKGVHAATELNQYSFEVHPQASKADVKRAVQELFNVRVLHVRTQSRRGKPRRYRYRAGCTKDWKKAVVTLDKEHRINFF
jgi:large subunit ribosomal protein L23